MSFVQATTGSGGWPMTVFLTHELKPFYGGTYFPPASRWGRPGFADLLGELARVWKEERPEVETAAAELLERLRSVTDAHGESEIAVGGGARHRGRAVSDGVRSPARRFWRRSEVSPTVRAVVPPSGACQAIRGGRRSGGAPSDGGRDPAGDGARRDARSRRRRLPSILCRRRVARAALREDALRPGAARAGVPRSRAGNRRRASTRPSPKTRSRTSSAT